MTASFEEMGDTMLIAVLFPGKQHEWYLSWKELLPLLKSRFPGMLVSESKAIEFLMPNYNKLIEMNAPEIILQGHRNIMNRSACFEMTYPNGTSGRISFMVIPDEAIDVHYNDGPNQIGDELLRDVVQSIADAIKYEYRLTLPSES